VTVERRPRLSAAERRERIELAATEVFAEHGYHDASMDEIAQRSGVSIPVVYDHFSSKRDLHRRLLERHFAALRGIWAVHLTGEGLPQERMERVCDAWFAYVETHPYAWRMLFRDATGDPEIEAIHREVAAGSRALLLPLLAADPVAVGASDARLELLWELVRAVLQGLALWWYEHRDVPRREVVATAMDGLWLGFERLGHGELWSLREP